MTPTTTSPFAIVTGASSGIGYELARQFAEHGFDLLVVAEDEGISSAAARLGSVDGRFVESLRADLATYEGNEKVCERARSIGRPVDAIAINAGVGVWGRFADTDLAAHMNLINLNVVSPVHLTQRLLKDMLARGAGRILYTSSIAGVMPGPFEATYNA